MEAISDFIISLLPSNSLVFIAYLVIVPLLGIVIIFLFRKKEKEEKKLTIDELLKIAKYKKSTLSDLAFVLNYFLENFKIKDNEKKSLELFEAVLTHKNRGKVLFDIFHNKIVAKNKEYEDILNKLEKEALNR